MRFKTFTPLLLIGLMLFTQCGQKKQISENAVVAPDTISDIVREAWIYGYPMIYNYKTIYEYAVNTGSPTYKGGFNRFKHYDRSFDWTDTTIVTPNNDTPYSWGFLDLRAEPVILQVPDIKGGRYYTMQLVDMYTYNFEYVGTRLNDNKAGNYLIAGPSWKGEKPAGITDVISSETDFVTILGRTELRGGSDMKNVAAIQQKYKLIPLHEFAKTTAPAVIPLPDFPVWGNESAKSLSYFNYLNFLLQYASVHPTEAKLREKFASVGIKASHVFDTIALSPDILKGFRKGMNDGKQELAATEAKTTSSLGIFGSRESMKDDYDKRAVAAAMGIYGNSKEEAVYVGTHKDAEGNFFMGEQPHILHFMKEELPTYKFFWSITMYNLPARHLIKNSINRYSIGDRTEGIKYNKDGSLDIYLQHEKPSVDKISNWLPAPKGAYTIIARIYGPGEDVQSGKWELPFPEKIK